MGIDWHARFLQQAAWTRDLRNYLYQRAGLVDARRVLEVGCGTGVLLTEIRQRAGAQVFGVDIDIERLSISNVYAKGAILTQANGLCLPFGKAIFDLAICHFLLLWVKDPLRVVAEMRRVTRPGGAVLALAEPDYGGRIDYPDEFSTLGARQKFSLENQGADPLLGRKLKGIFHRAGIKDTETGILGAQWPPHLVSDEFDLEWAALEHDLEGLYSPEEIQKIRSRELSSWERGERILFVPTFFAWGHV
jgi:SAM-dependent methyltransferase